VLAHARDERDVKAAVFERASQRRAEPTRTDDADGVAHAFPFRDICAIGSACMQARVGEAARDADTRAAIDVNK
jgi:hypothetical protein